MIMQLYKSKIKRQLPLLTFSREPSYDVSKIITAKDRRAIPIHNFKKLWNLGHKFEFWSFKEKPLLWGKSIFPRDQIYKIHALVFTERGYIPLPQLLKRRLLPSTIIGIDVKTIPSHELYNSYNYAIKKLVQDSYSDTACTLLTPIGKVGETSTEYGIKFKVIGKEGMSIDYKWARYLKQDSFFRAFTTASHTIEENCFKDEGDIITYTPYIG
jgi:hypothetical protein